MKVTSVSSPQSSWFTVSAAGDYTCAMKTDATLWCWGINVYGQIGDGMAG